MPKDPARNQPNYKIGGSHLNEFEFNQQHGAMTEEEHQSFPGQHETPGLPGEQAAQETEAERVARMMEEARAVVAKRRGSRASVSTKKSGATKKSAAKKSAAKGAKKSAAKKSVATKKTGARAASSKKGGAARKGAGKKGGAKGSGAGKKAGARGSSPTRSTAKKSAGKKGAKKGGTRRK
jgi:hypothetical protein